MIRFVFSLALLLLALPASGQLLQGRLRAAVGGGSPVDWTASFVAVWRCEETSGDRANDTATSCGSDCDLTDNNTVGYGVGIEGTNACDFELDNTESLDCDHNASGCDELETMAEGSAVSMLLWTATESANDPNVTHFKISGGWSTYQHWSIERLRYSSPIREIYARHYDGTTFSYTYSDFGEPTDDTWTHVALTWANDADDEMLTYINGEESTDGSPATISSNLTLDANGDTRLGWKHDGRLDEIAAIGVELTAAQICRICSCGIDGSECVCSGSTYTDSGRNSANCGSCTLPDCDAAAP